MWIPAEMLVMIMTKMKMITLIVSVAVEVKEAVVPDATHVNDNQHRLIVITSQG
jgi:hypothetical protein